VSFLQTLIDTIPNPLFYKDAKGEYLSVNRAFEEFYGKNREEIIGKTVYDMAPKNIADKYYEKDQELFQCPGKQTYEWKVVNAAGELRDVIFNKASYRNQEGTVIGLIGVISDITDRKQTEIDLRNSEEHFRLLIENISDIITVIDDTGIIRYESPSLERILGYKPEELVGKNGFELVHPDDLPVLADKFAQSFLTPGVSDSIQMRLRHKDGSLRIIEAIGMWIPDGRGQLSLVLNSHDITETMQAKEEKDKMEAQLIQAQKMESVGRLAGGVAHDFNNKLAIILGYAELGLSKVNPSQPLHSDLEEIRMAACQSADLTRQLLAFARKQTISPEALDLNETVEGMLKMLRRLIGEDIDLAWLPDKSLWQVMMDPSQIDQILANLCVNARDAISGVGKMTIETGNRIFDKDYCTSHPGFVPGEYVLLIVSDNGCGMDKETQLHIFEPFFTTKEMGKGTGLGLATVYGIVKQNNGFIYAYSEPEQGTTFTINLPRHVGKAAQMQKEDSAEPAAHGHETILLVEDDPDILHMTTMMLDKQGYTVLAANTPGEAIRMAEVHNGHIHLVMTDVVMPDMNGRDLVRNLLSRYPNLRSLYMSGYTADIIAHHGVLDPGVNFIQKPFSIKNLAVKVRDVLDYTKRSA
jgi:PAS domain S-box-containing protein